MKNNWVSVSAVVMCAILISITAEAEAVSRRNLSGSDTLIDVNGIKMTREEFKKQMDREWEIYISSKNTQSNEDADTEDIKVQIASRLLNSLIERYIVLSFAAKDKINIPADSVQAEINKIIETYKNEAEFDSALKQTGRTRDELKERIKEELTIRTYVLNQIGEPVATETEARIFYMTNRTRFNQPARVHAKHILINDDTNSQKTLREIKNRLDKGETFSKLAEEYSVCPSARNGGDLGTFGKGQMVKPFEDSAFSLPIGKVSEPVKTEFGWHYILVEERFEEGIMPFDDVKGRIIELLSDRKGDMEIQKLTQKLRLQSKIHINGPIVW